MSVRVGQLRPLKMRRIGSHHVVVLPAQTAQVVDLRQAKRQLSLLRGQEGKLRAELAALAPRIADLDATIRQAEGLAVERVEDDPEVEGASKSEEPAAAE